MSIWCCCLPLSIVSNAMLWHFYHPQTKFGKSLCFYSSLSFCLSGGGISCWTETPTQRPPWTDTPLTESPWRETPWTETTLWQRPPGQRPPFKRDFLGQTPPGQIHPIPGNWSGRYAFFWNAYLYHILRSYFNFRIEWSYGAISRTSTKYWILNINLSYWWNVLFLHKRFKHQDIIRFNVMARDISLSARQV